MGFLSDLAALLIEWFLAQIAKFGVGEIKTLESEAEIKKEALEDQAAIVAATDEASRVAALNKTIEDTFEDPSTDTTTVKPN
jgi:hypothetical protein